MVTNEVFFSGQVQGVGFRFVAKSKADSLGLKGWVKNLADGRVKAVFQGEKKDIEKIIKEMEESFLIQETKVSETGKKDFESFEIIL